MSKKILGICMAIAALAAFALPATASATNDPDITHPTGTLLNPVEKETTVEGKTVIDYRKIKATSLETLRFTSGGATVVTCASSTMTGQLEKNTGTLVEGTISSTSFSGTGAGGKCTSTFGGDTAVNTTTGNGTPWCLRSTSTMVTDEFQVRGNACTAEQRSITFVLETTNIGNCKYNRAAAIPGTYTTHATGDAILSIEGVEFTKEEGSILCPSTGLVDLKYTLETDTATAEPLYIS